MNRQHQLYEKIGHLFYAVASVDRQLTTDEVSRLKHVIRREWLPLEDTDEFCVDAARNIFFAFDSIQTQQAEPAYAYENFVQFYYDNKEDFNSLVREKILHTTKTLTTIKAASPELVQELSTLISTQPTNSFKSCL